MGDPKVTFERLEGDSYETGYIILKAVFETRSVIIKTTFHQIKDLQKKLAEQLGAIYTDRFQQISMEQLESCGGVLIDFFFDDALGKEFITHNEHFLRFFSNVQKIPNDNNNKQAVAAVKDDNKIVQEQEKQLQTIGQVNYKQINFQQEQTVQIKEDDANQVWKQRATIINNQIFHDYDVEQDSLQDQFKMYNNKDYSYNFDNQYDSLLSQRKPQIKTKEIMKQNNKPGNRRTKTVVPIENIYSSNRGLLEEKIHSDKKYIKFSSYFRKKIKSKLKFLFKQRQNMSDQMIQKCFDCCKCLKNMYFGIRCFKCKREDVYYCHDCNTKCPNCGVLLKKTNDHVNINNFHRLLSDSFKTCQACRDDIPLIKFEEHLYQCEDNEEACRYCNELYHFRDLKKHIEKYCQQKPVVCPICNAKYQKYKQTSHQCMKRFFKVNNEARHQFTNMKESLSSKFQSIQEKLKIINQPQHYLAKPY